MECGNMGLFDRGVQMLLTTVGAFAAFSLMTIAVGTDYWLYSRGVCKTKSMSENETSKKNEEVMTHSGLWRTCCLEGKGLRKSYNSSKSWCTKARQKKQKNRHLRSIFDRTRDREKYESRWHLDIVLKLEDIFPLFPIRTAGICL